jgi:hypothetical protein
MRYLHKKNKDHFTKLEFHGDKIKCRQAPEPSDIIWENLNMSNGQKRKNECISYIIILAFLILTLFLFTYLKGFASVNAFKYPAIDCI